MAVTPEGLNTVTLQGQYVLTDDAGTPQQGSLTFTPSPGLITFATQNVMVTGTQTVTLDGTGAFSIDLVCTDTAGQNPTGWTYAVVEKIVGNSPRNFNILLPYTAAIINLADITPTDAAPTYLPVVGPQGPPGVLTTVNGKTGSSITLNSADIGAVPTSSLGAASGVAQLDSGTHVVAAQLAFATATPAAVSTAGAVGTGTLVARNDHSHPGVDLTSAQTIAGIKTFSASPVGPDPTTSTQLTTKNYTDTTYVALTGAQTVAGVKTFSSSPIAPTPTTSTQVVIKSYADGAQIFTGTKTFLQASGTSIAIATQATGDTFNEFELDLNGTHNWGTGAAATDTNLFRAGVGLLQTSSTFVSTGAKIIQQGGSFQNTASATTNNAFHFFVTGDTVDRLTIRADGKMTWSDGTTADTNLYRSGAGILMTDAQFQTNNTSITVTRSAGTSPGYKVIVTGDTVERLNIRADGQLGWSTGAATADTFLARTGVARLTLTGGITVTGSATISGDLTVVGVGSVVTAVKAADTSRISTTTLLADPHLTMTLQPGTYDLDAKLFYEADTAGDLKLNWSVQAGTTGAWWPGGADNSMSTIAFATRWGAPTDFGTTSLPVGAIGAGSVLACRIMGTVTITTAGTFALMWAQQASTAVNTTLHAFSSLSLRRIS